MNWFMLANELIQYFRNTSIATTVRKQALKNIGSGVPRWCDELQNLIARLL